MQSVLRTMHSVCRACQAGSCTLCVLRVMHARLAHAHLCFACHALCVPCMPGWLMHTLCFACHALCMRHTCQAGAEESFKRLSLAYETLSDERQRGEYDRERMVRDT